MIDAAEKHFLDGYFFVLYSTPDAKGGLVRMAYQIKRLPHWMYELRKPADLVLFKCFWGG